MERDKQIIIVRGGGDIATGTISKLHHCGYPVLVLESQTPTAIRRHVAFSEAVYEGQSQVEDVTCKLADSMVANPMGVNPMESVQGIWREGKVAMMVDPDCRVLKVCRPWALVDAILAKRNLGTGRHMAPKTVALGPGFVAGRDVDAVIETMRGHNLGRIIWEGSALPNTGVPGIINGHGKDRVIHAPADGVLRACCRIGDFVNQGQIIAWITREGQQPVGVEASLTGLLRGLIRDGFGVKKGLKIADIDPRKSEYENCFTISDKARCIAGSVLEALQQMEYLSYAGGEKMHKGKEW